jgi:hypothetical protein
MPVRVTRELLLPGWIMGFGLVILSAPPLGAAWSLSLFLVGVVVFPALVLVRTSQSESPPASA